MDDNDKLRDLLKAWQTPPPREDFDNQVLGRLRNSPGPVTVWQRWVAEPWEALTVLWHQWALGLVGIAALALVLGISVVALPGVHRERSADAGLFRLDVFRAGPRASVTSSYLEAMKQ